jgi:RNA recognition motif-containing protein
MGKRRYVGNLPWSTSSSELQAMFEQFGAVRSAEVIMDRVTGRSRGFGFVEMDDDEAMNAAIEALHEKEMNGRPLVVNEARERSPRPQGGAGRGARGGSGRYGDR